MESLFLIKPGEILLKKENQKEFTRRLVQQLHKRLGDIGATIEESPGRFFLFVDDRHAARAEFVLGHCPGLNGFSRATMCPKTPEAILGAAESVAATCLAAGMRRFKVETRRSDKSFPLGSYAMCAKAGEVLLEKFPPLVVDVHEPDFVITIEIRERAYVYGQTQPGPRGLPSGTSGKGLLLLSGGIDSPVAGYMMAKRGAPLECVYFHAYPYTSMEAQRKVERLALKITAWSGSLRLWVIPFTDVQMQIKKLAREDSTTIMLRSAMMEAADKLARKIGADMIITGESLGQVASQTAENMAITEAPSNLPIFRPLIGIDKEETVGMAKRIGTYEISILPYEDCCVLFSPKHPILKPSLREQVAAYGELGLSPLIEESLSKAEKFIYRYRDVLEDFGID
jgi:thiamine biosynthesis protein ThiI